MADGFWVLGGASGGGRRVYSPGNGTPGKNGRQAGHGARAHRGEARNDEAATRKVPENIEIVASQK